MSYGGGLSVWKRTNGKCEMCCISSIFGNVMENCSFSHYEYDLYGRTKSSPSRITFSSVYYPCLEQIRERLELAVFFC